MAPDRKDGEQDGAGQADLRVGLVLGAGGVQGGAWLTGALQALASGTGWDPASAEYVVGTSAGSMVARARQRGRDRGAARLIRPPAGPPSGWPAQLGGPWGRAALA